MSKLINSLFWAVAIITFVMPPLTARAIMVPQIYFTGDPIIESVNFDAGQTITGTVEIWNYEESAMSDLMFNYQLLAGEKNSVPTELIDNSQVGAIFSLVAGEKAIKEFSYVLPSNLQSANYTLRIQIVNGRGEELAWADKVINVGGSGKFLTIKNGAIAKNGQLLSSAAGVYYQPGEVAAIQFEVVNESGFTISAIPSVITYNRNVGGEVIGKRDEAGIVIEANNKKTVTYALSKTNIPETYLSEVKLLDPSTREIISNVLLFRWIISGESARTLYVSSDKLAYRAGDEARINIQYNGPADHEIEGGTGTLNVKLSNSKNIVIGEAIQQIELKPGSVTVDIPVKESVDKFKIGVAISKGNKGFDNYEIKIMPEGEQWDEVAAPIQTQEKDNGLKGKFIFGAVALVLLIISIGIVSRKKKGAVVSCFLVVAVASSLVASGVQAAIEVDSGCCNTTVHFNAPIPNIELYPGGNVKFSNSYRVTSCGNGLFFNRAAYYITEDRDIPLVDAEGRNYNDCSDTKCTKGECLSCFGASSGTYECGHFTYGNVVKKLDTAQGYKIIELGTFNTSDVGSLNTRDWPHWVELNKSFTVPANLDMYGPVRLYVQYLGSHWDGHWHWNISYQKAFLRAVPAVVEGSLVATQPDYCTMNPAAAFKWNFHSADASASQAAYRIQISKSRSFSDPVYDSSVVNSASGAFSIPVGILNYNNTYYWRLKVIDSYGTESDWAEGDPIVTPVQPAPHPGITYTPDTAIVLQRMYFSSASSYCYSGMTKIACADSADAIYSWNFDNGDVSTIADDSTVFQRKGGYAVTLSITSAGLTCSATKDINVNASLPSWQEIGD